MSFKILDAEYRVRWDVHGYRFSNVLYKGSIDNWVQTLNYRIIEYSEWLESKIKSKVDTIIVSHLAVKELITELKNYNTINNTLNGVKVIDDLQYDNYMIKIFSSKEPNLSVGICPENLIGYYNDDF